MPTSRRRRTPATLGDVARAAGVSTATVSFVLNGRAQGRVSPATQERVRAVADRLGYVRNVQAGALRTGRGTLVVVDLAGTQRGNSAQARFAEAVVNQLVEAGYAVAMGSSAGRSQAEVLRRWLELRPAAVTFVAGALSGAVVDRLAAAGVPSVAVAAQPWSGAPTVVLDSSGLGELAAGHLHARGARSCLLVLPERADPTLPQDSRARGVRRVIEDLREVRVASTPHAVAGLVDTLRRDGMPDGVVGADDRLAALVVAALADRGVVAGRDVAVSGIGDEPFCELVRPALTSVAVDFAGGGRALCEALLAAVDGGPPTGEVRHVWSGELVPRST